MPRLRTIEEVRRIVKEKSDGKCEVISDEYQSCTIPLDIKCKCGKTFKRALRKIEAGSIFCPDCAKRELSKKFRKDDSDVIHGLIDAGCQYVSGDYINGRSLLTVRCRCGEIFKRSYIKILSGFNTCPKCSKESLRAAKTKHTIEEVRERLSQRGYELLEDKYTTCQSKMLCRCEKGHKFYIRYDWFLSGTSGCQKCAIENRKAIGNHNYQGGASKVSEALRYSLRNWKTAVSETYGNRCPVTGETENLTIHHLVSFTSIVEEICNELGIPNHLYGRIKDYENYSDFDKLRTTIVERHKMTDGILISKSVHKQFHALYGKGNNTPEQFDEFLKKHYNTSLAAILKKQMIPAMP